MAATIVPQSGLGVVDVTVDGHLVRVPLGATALEALRAAGLDVPTACHDPRLKPTGGCRLCLVGLEGSTKLVASCAYVVRPGDAILVETEELKDFRRHTVALLARSVDPVAFEALPEKTLHRWLREFGLQPEGVSGPCDETNPYFRFDPSACIECNKCVQICRELQGSDVWQVLDRGPGVHVAPDSLTTMAESTCKSCGACVDACPTAALVDKSRWETGRPTQWTRTVCPYCGVGCELSVGTIGDQIVQVLPVVDSPVNKGHLCVKGRYAHGYIHSPDRVLGPMVRRDGRLQPATWDEAIDAVAQKFQEVKKDHGPDSIGVLGSARAPNEDNYLAQKFARVVLGTNNVDCCARVCHGPTAAAMKVMLGTGAATNSFDDIELAHTILVSGCNPTENHPVVGERIKQRVRNGARLIVVDPRAIELATMADVHLAIHPGTNIPLYNAMVNACIAEGWVDADFVGGRTEGFEELSRHVKPWTPERAADICGVNAGDIRRAAQIYATSGPSLAVHGLGMTEHVQGTEGVMALVNLALVTGNVGRPGSGVNPLRGQNNVQGSAHMGCEPSNLTGFVSVADGAGRFSSVWGQDLPTRPGKNLMQMLDAALEGDLKALWAIGYDVVFTNPRVSETRAAFESMDFVVVQDIFLNETAKEFADVFLPACSSFERDGTFMNAERRVQRVRKAVPPIGDSLPDWEIIQRVAQAMGHSSGFSFESAEDVWDEVRKVWQPGAGISYQRLESGGLQWPCTSEDHPGTTTLHQDSFPIGPRAKLQCLDFHPSPETTDTEFPFVLNSGRTLYQFNAGTMTMRTRNKELRPTDLLEIHPDDARRAGIREGQLVRLTSRNGECLIPAKVTRKVRPGELFATFHSPEVFLNLLTTGLRDNRVGTPEFKRTAVKIEPAGQSQRPI